MVVIEIEEDQKELRLIEVEVATEETELLAFLQSVSVAVGLPAEELILDLGVGEVHFHPNAMLSECLRHGHRWRHRRVCVDLHFESDSAKHHFPARGTWELVHEWGCQKFEVPRDLRANLELREGSTTGPALNDRVQIGHHKGCMTVWLVKPGPEPFGDVR
jgi:hypothetical protein